MRLLDYWVSTASVSIAFSLFIEKPLAALSCLHQSSGMHVDSAARNIIEVAEFGGPGRKSAEQYATEHHVSVKNLKQTYAASGEMMCAGDMSQVSLVKDHSTIVVSLHALFKDRSCTLAAPLSACTVRFEVNGTDQNYKLSQIVETGAPCPHEGNATDAQDWAVVHLSKPVQGVTPYQISRQVRTSSAVVAVGESADIFQTGVKGETYPKHYSDCAIRKIYPDRTYGTNCGGAKGSSGSGIFDPSTEVPTLLGLNYGSTERVPDLLDARAHHRVNNHPFDAGAWASFYVPIQGRLLDLLSNEQPSSRPETPKSFAPVPEVPAAPQKPDQRSAPSNDGEDI